MSNVGEPAPIPKAENSDLESFSESSPEPDDPNFIREEVAQVQKRKGGRKPVGNVIDCKEITLTSLFRYMQRQRKGNRETGRLKQHSESDGRNTSNSWRPP